MVIYALGGGELHSVLRHPYTPPPAGYNVVLIAGQSNASGPGAPYLVGVDDVTYPRIKTWPGQGEDVGSIVPAFESLGGQPPNVVGESVGVGMAFGRTYLEHIASTRSILFVPTAVGATALVGGPWAVGGTYYNGAIALANGAMAAAGENSELVAILWLQGEDDSGASRTQAAYAAALDATLTGFRSGITNGSGAAVVIGPMVPEWREAPNGTSLQIHAAHVDTPNRLDNAYYVDGPGYGYGQNLGNIHWNAAAMRYIGQAMSEAIT